MQRILLALVCVFVILAMSTSCFADSLQDSYNAALLLLTQGKYAEAAQAFDNLFGYEDSSMYATYAKGLDAGEKGNYDLALQASEMLGGFRDSTLQYQYYQARQYESWDDFWSWDQAILIYEDMQLFRDCYSRIEGLQEKKHDRYDEALELGHSGSYEEAASAFSGMNDYGRSYDYSQYYWACSAEQSNDFNSALYYLGYLRGLGDFENSQEKYLTYGNHYIDWLTVGDTVDFGYNQWYVLDIDKPGKRILLLMVNTLDHYCEYKMRTWENSEMREWLNRSYDGFLNDNYFHEYDYDLIETTRVKQSAGTDFTDGTFEILYMGSDSDVYDKIFALSVEEAEQYLPLLGSDSEMPGYWLRDTYAKYNNWGSSYWENYGYYVYNDEIKHRSYTDSGREDIRPALWINLN